MKKFTKMFLLFAVYMLWTYSVMPDVQTSIVAFQTGVHHKEIIALWVISLLGTVVFFGLLYDVGELPS